MIRHMDKIVFAFDKQTARSKDADGRLRVKNCVLSTAEINPYRGSEIPKSSELGLSANAIYELYRDPAELGSPEALASFEGVPLMIKHVPQSASEPRKEYQAGAVHSIRFDGKHLRGDLLVSDGLAIDLIESDELSDLSCGYRYYPVMVPGSVAGGKYDGRMTQIRGNHVALVDDGRATDAHVADSAFVDPRGPNPTMQGDSTMALPDADKPGVQPEAATAATAAAPVGDLSELTALLKQMITQNSEAHQAILAKLNGDVTTADEDADPSAPPPDALEAQDMDLEAKPAHQGPDGAEDEDAESVKEPSDVRDPQGPDATPDGTGTRGEAIPFGAMDAKSVRRAVEHAVTAERQRNRAANTAKREVAHILGGDIALDSAEDVYREALSQVGVTIPQGTSAHATWNGYKAASARVAGVLPGAEGSMALDSAPANAARTSTHNHLSRIKVRG